jgi:nucleoporin GLE1
VSTKQKDIALTMAPIIVQLWSRFPTFGQIFMAQMQEKCPYIIPYYPKKETDDSERDHLIACGYNIAKDGTQESEESFLNRMKAMVKLYAAIIQSNLQDNHPHDLNYGWTWTARLLNLEPRTAITAAVLESFLSITSHKFYRFYRKQFIKIIKFILSDYIPRIENVSKKGTKRQSLVKLSMFIIDVNKKLEKNVNYKELMPEGVLPDYFFQTSYSHSWGTQTFA